MMAKEDSIPKDGIEKVEGHEGAPEDLAAKASVGRTASATPGSASQSVMGFQ